MENKRIDDFIEMLADLSTFLTAIKFRNAELEQKAKISEAVENYLDGFSIARAPMRNVDDALQLNMGKREELGIEQIFTEKEIKTMPKLKDLSYRYKENVRSHEFRYRRNGISKSFSSTDFKEAKRKALEFCRQLNLQEKGALDKNVMFNKFATDYMQNVKRKNVSEKTFFNDYNRFENYVLPAFQRLKVKDVRAPFIQKFLNDVLDAGHQRTAEALFYILKTILDYAVNTDVILKNPMCAVKIPMHVREIGKALPIDMEKKFVNAIAGHKYELTFAVLLFTGCRPCELESLVFEKDGFLTFRNRKQKKNAIVYKDIPITPMLEPYVERLKKELPLNQTTELGKIFAKLVPGYRLYDLRHTFATRCQTCGVPQEIVSRWLGHKTSRITDNVYTHFPPEFMLKQAKKVVY